MFYKQIKKKQDGTYEFIGAENPSTSNIPVKKNIIIIMVLFYIFIQYYAVLKEIYIQ